MNTTTIKAEILKVKYQFLMGAETVSIGEVTVNKVQWESALAFLEGQAEPTKETLQVLEQLLAPKKPEFDHEAHTIIVPKINAERTYEYLTTLEEAEAYNLKANITNRTAEEKLIIHAKNNPDRRLFNFVVEPSVTGFVIKEVNWDVELQESRFSYKIACMVEQGVTRSEFDSLKQSLYGKQQLSNLK